MTSVKKSKLEELRASFVAKLGDRIQEVEDAIQSLGRAENQEQALNTLYNRVHSLYGASATYGMTRLARALSHLEGLLYALLSKKSTLTQSQSQAITQRFQRCKTIVDEGDLAPLAAASLAPGKPNQSPLVYVIEDEDHQRELIGRYLDTSGYRVMLFSSLGACKAAIRTTSPSLIVLDLMLPDSGELPVADMILDLGFNDESRIPIIVLSVRDDLQCRLDAYRAGASRYLTKPCDGERLCAAVDEITDRQPEEPYRVLLVDDDASVLSFEQEVLQESGLEVLAISDPMQTLERLQSFVADVIVLDVYMPEVSGPELAAVIRGDDETQQVPILFLSTERDLTRQLTALNLGGDDFLVKPIQAEHFVSAVTARAKRHRQLCAAKNALQRQHYEREREHRALDQHAIVSVADRSGKITRVNQKFCEISGYQASQLVGQSHRVVKSGHHSDDFYKEMWQTISSGQTWKGEVCNRRSDGELYWVHSTITPFLDDNGRPYQYVSIRTDITQSKKYQKDLEQAQETLTSTLESTADGILVLDTRGEPRFANGRLYEVWFSEDSQRPRDLESLRRQIPLQLKTVFPVDFSALYQQLRNSKHEHFGTVELNDRRIMEHYSRPMVVADQIVGRVWSFRDVTDRYRAAEELTRANILLEKSNAAANIGTWEYDIASSTLYWDKVTRSIHGVADDFIPNLETGIDFYKEGESRDSIAALFEELVEYGSSYDEELMIVTVNGQERWVRAIGMRTDYNEKDAKAYGLFQDIDEQKKSRVRIAESERQLKEAQTIAHIGSWSFNPETRLFNVSDEVYRIFERSPNADLSFASFAQLIHPEDIVKFERISDPNLIEDRENIVIRINLENGNNKYVRLIARLGQDPENRSQRVLGTVQDISAEVMAMQQLTDAVKSAEQANRAKSEFLSNMSHELRTPLNAILGFSQVLELDQTLTDDNRESVQEIHKAGGHLLELINEVLDLAKVESGKLEMEIESIMLDAVVQSCISLMTPLAKKRSVNIVSYDLSKINVLADRVRLKQVLLNLLSNAIKYNHDSGSVWIDAYEVSPTRVRIEVKDNGPGIEDDLVARIYEPFERLGRESQNIEGTGIGLTLVRSMVEQMGGDTGLDTVLHSGSTFWIELPIGRTETNSAIIPRKAFYNDQTKSRECSADTQFSILYIEDNPANLKLVEKVLHKRKDNRFYAANEPRLGLEIAQSKLPDLILLDINLPQMDGYRVLSLLREDAATKDIPVVALTANAMAADREKALQKGFSDYISKPVKIDDLNEIVDRAIRSWYPA